MILILAGTLLGSLCGFKAQEIIPKTEIFHIQNIFTTGRLTIVPPFSGRINDFWITYTKQKTVTQFYSDISILNMIGNEIDRKTSFVNTPLIHENVYYYQTDWDLIGLRFEDSDGKTIEYPLINLLNKKNKIWLTWISNDLTITKGIIAIIDNLEGYCSIYSENGLFLGNLELNEKIGKNQEIKLVEILSSTGLQIKRDPGIPIIYTGFFLLMLSTLFSYITYSQIWIIKENKKIFVGGNTTRAIFEFELEFLKLIQ